jgi:hypothetical protein
MDSSIRNVTAEYNNIFINSVKEVISKVKRVRDMYYSDSIVSLEISAPTNYNDNIFCAQIDVELTATEHNKIVRPDGIIINPIKRYTSVSSEDLYKYISILIRHKETQKLKIIINYGVPESQDIS